MKERVIFRVFKESGSIIALLPDQEANHGYIMTYMHIGQHGEGLLNNLIPATREATEEEYTPLLRELESLGYKLAVIKRSSLNEVS